MDGLIVVDVQNDFCPGGALAVPDGDAVVDPINRLMQEFEFIVATRDWHPPDHRSFAIEGGRWPVHCVAGTGGAELHPKLHSSQIDAIVDKGRGRDDSGYSGFEKTDLKRLLRDRGVERVHVVGLALDYCVRATALDARQLGLEVVLRLAATRAIDAEPGDTERALAEIGEAGVEVVSEP
jgi:nicotinamidase/pyrazinamidase